MVIAAMIASAGLSSAADAVVNTRVDWQVSLDNMNWSTSVTANPGQTVYSRALVSYTGTATPVGLASMTFQPTVSNWDDTPPADMLLPFVNNGQGSNTSTPPGVVTNPNDPSQFGRISPFGRSSTSSSSAIRGFVQTGPGPATNPVPPGTWLRIAQSQVTAWIGGTGNTTGGSGVNIAQLSNVGRTTSDPAFLAQTQNIQVFKFGVTLGDLTGRTMVVDSPTAGFGNLNSATGEREVYWFNTLQEATGQERGTAIVNTASIIVPVPTPASVALLGLAGLVVTRRRRHAVA